MPPERESVIFVSSQRWSQHVTVQMLLIVLECVIKSLRNILFVASPCLNLVISLFETGDGYPILKMSAPRSCGFSHKQVDITCDRGTN